MSESDDIDNTLMISERYLRGRADGPHGATCARCGQGGEDRQSPPGLASQRPGVNPKASSLLWQWPACTPADSSPPSPPHLKADPQVQGTKHTAEATGFR